MRASRRRLFTALLCVTTFALSAFSAATESNQEIANRVLGSQWQSLSQRAGMIFAGTVLSSGSQTVRMDRSVPAIELRFRVDRPIAGVAAGQVLTIHEWAGASSGHRPLRRGEHILIFLYPPSRLGLTSPVAGSLGQIGLDSTGQYVAATNHVATEIVQRDQLEPSNQRPSANSLIKVSQLERAIRAARGE